MCIGKAQQFNENRAGLAAGGIDFAVGFAECFSVKAL